MTENAMAFALNTDFFCKFADDSIILNFDTDSLSRTAVDTILSTFSDDVASYMKKPERA